MNAKIWVLTTLPLIGIFSSAQAACLPTPSWADAQDPETCEITIEGIGFQREGQVTGNTAPGKRNPDFRNHLDALGGRCELGNALWWNNRIHEAPAGHDLSNPNYHSHLKYFYIKDSVHEKTYHVAGGHEDLLQMQGALNGGGWLVAQDSVFKNAGENAFIMIGTGGDGYGNGPGSDYLCPDSIGTGGVLLQGVQIGPNDPGFSGNLQAGFGGRGKGLPELWFVDVDYSGSGIAVFEPTGKVVVVGGTGGENGWPGPLKPRYPWDDINVSDCPADGWRDGACCPNGQVNTKGQVMNWTGTKGDNPSNGAIPVYCYTSVEAARQDNHQLPPFITLSESGWENPEAPSNNELKENSPPLAPEDLRLSQNMISG